MISSKDIQSFILKHWLEKHHCPFVCSNFEGVGFAEMDAMVVSRAGIVTEFEIKISRGDFKADFEKPKHPLMKGQYEGLFSPQEERNPWHKVPNKFYFAVPKGLVMPEEVPDYAGLIYFTKYKLATHPGQEFIEFEYGRKAPYIHRDKAGPELIARICQTLSARLVFGCALMTYQNKQIKERIHHG